MKKILPERSLTLTLVFGILFTFLNSTNSIGQILIDGNFETDYLNEQFINLGTVSATCEVGDIYAAVVTHTDNNDYLVLGIHNGNNGEAIFRFFIDSQEDYGTDNYVYKKVSYPINDADRMLEIYAASNSFSSYIYNGTDFVPEVNSEIIGLQGDYDPNDGKFLEIAIPISYFPSICNPDDNGNINLSTYIAFSGGGNSSVCGWSTLDFNIGLGGQLAHDTTVCSGDNSTTLSLTGEKGVIEDWYFSTDSGTTWDPLGHTDSIYTAENLTQDTWYQVRVSAANNGLCNDGNENVELKSTIAKITVEECCTETVAASAADSSVCEGDNIDLSATAVIDAISYTWSGPDNYSYDGQDPPAFASTIAKNGEYIVSVDYGNGCVALDTVEIIVNALPSANAGEDFTITCTENIGGKVIGEDNDATASYSWSPALGLSSTTVSNPTANPSVTTTYTVTKTDLTSGCFDTDEITVTVDSAATTAVAGEDFTITCTENIGGKVIGEDNDATASYSWSPALGLSSTTVSNPTANPSVTTTYTVTKTDLTSGCFDTDEITVTVDSAATTAVAGEDFTITCTENIGGKVIGEDNDATASYSWSPALGLSSTTVSNPTANPSVTTTYTVTKTDLTSGCFDTDEITVTVDSAATTAVAGEDFTITCTENIGGKVIGEDNDATASYSWSPALGLSSTTVSNPTANPSVTTTYTVTKTDLTSGCFDTDEITVTVDSAATTAVAGEDFTITCTENIGGKVIGEDNDATASYSWSPALGLSSTTVSNPTANPSVTTTYTVTKTDLTSGCFDTDEITVTVDSAATTAVAGEDFTITCTENIGGKVIGEDNDATASYSWSPALGLSSTTVSNPTANPSVTTTYTVTKTDLTSGCFDTDEITVTVDSAATTAVAGEDFTITCTENIGGKVIGEDNDATASYSWSPALGLSSTTVSNPTANPSVTTTYTVTKTDLTSGCFDTDEITVTVDSAATTAVAGEDFTITCTENIGGKVIGEDNDATASYSWSPALGLSSTTVSNPTANPSVTTTYTVTKTDLTSGCFDTDEITVTVDSAATTAVAGEDFTITCTENIGGKVIGEDNDATASYSWSPALGLSSTTVSNPTANPSVTTTYTVTKTDLTSGCFDTDEITVTVDSAATTAVAGEDFTITCTENIGGKVIGEDNDATASYSWSPALGLSSTTVSNPTANPSVTTTYTVTKTDLTSGCFDTDEITVTVDSAATTAVAGEDFTITCTENIGGKVIGEDNDATASYSWSPALGLSSTTVSNPTANPSVTTTYTVTKTDLTSGCFDTDEITVTVDSAATTAVAGRFYNYMY
ncbi:hypothetical protein [uncultured Draconibacterium sp.]|uniref:hypothetical protein n=1 Tax=uncultured Draconibacterium sp. TaxID=1573823 RepID=UPI002AA8E88A|nr:hypothetical protein [uncultured Draconibacterium sp.]